MYFNKKPKYFCVIFSALLAWFLLSNNQSVFAASASITTSGTVSIDVSASGNGAGVGVDNVVVNTTCATGYTVSIQGSSSDAKLYKDGDNTSESFISPSIGTASAPVSILDNDKRNTWGYSLTSSDVNGNFIGITNTANTIITKNNSSAAGGDTYPVYYGVSVDASLEQGIYTMANNATIIYHMVMPIECEPYTIVYDGNGADAGQTMSIKNTGIEKDDEVALYASNYKRAGYGFAGWSLTQIDPDASDAASQINLATIYGPNETITVDQLMIDLADPDTHYITLYAVWVKSGGDMQSWAGCGSMGVGRVIALKDTRDNNVYAVGRLSDGNCWMMENLRLNNSANINSSNTQNPPAGFTNLSASSTNWCTDSTSAACTDQPFINTDNTVNPVADMTAANQNIYAYGNYYNWYSATASYGKYDSNNHNQAIAGSICPIGWHLPTSGDDTVWRYSNFYVLVSNIVGAAPNAAYATNYGFYNGAEGINAIKKISAFPNNFIKAGYFHGMASSGKNEFMDYWASTQYHDSQYAFELGTMTDALYYSGVGPKDNGYPIRCMTEAPFTVKFDRGTGSGTMTDQVINYNIPTALKTSSFTAPTNRDSFLGWTTNADGSGTRYRNGQEVMNIIEPGGTITLYAQWGCAANTVCYYSNGATASGTVAAPTMADQSIDTSDPHNMLIASNFKRANYGFAGWNTKADGTGTYYGPNETLTNDLSWEGIKLYAIWIASEGNMQGFTEANCKAKAIGSVFARKDTRDNNVYAIARLDDGRCWMIENLRLGAATITTANTHNPLGGFGNLAASNNITGAWCVITSSSTLANRTSCINKKAFNNMNTSSTVTVATGHDQNIYAYGHYYNYYTASVGHGPITVGTNNGETYGGICPNGWHLAWAGDNNNFSTGRDAYYVLSKAIFGSGPTFFEPESDPTGRHPFYAGAEYYNKMRTYPYNYVMSGYILGTINYRGTEGRYWSGSIHGEEVAYSPYITTGGWNPGTGSAGKNMGLPIRCINHYTP